MSETESFLPDTGSQGPTDVQLTRALKTYGVSDQGEKWLSYATNLFSDEAIDKARCPDGGVQLTQIIEVPADFSIQKPVSIPDGTKWGFHIVQTPFTASHKFSHGTSTGNAIIEEAPGTVADMAGIFVQYFTLDNNTFDAIPVADQQLTVVPDLGVISPLRLTSQAFEVTSTASALVEQGSCTAYRAPVAPNVDYRYFGDPESSTGRPCITMRLPPRNKKEAVRLPGTRTWKAKHGLLSQGWLEDVVNDVEMPNCLPIVALPDSDSYGDSCWYTRSAYDTNAVPTQLLDGMYNGAFFSELGDDSTFHVQVKWAYEVFPGVNEIPTIYNASLRPDPDFKAIETYLATARHAPVGWYVSSNASGDAWRDIKSVLWSALDGLASSEIPFVSTVAKGVKFARNIVNTVSGSNKTKAKSKNKSQAQKTLTSGGGPKTQLMSGQPKATRTK